MLGGFNGAVDKRRRRDDQGPRVSLAPERFNGAVDKRRRRATARTGAAARVRQLQWGRRQASTESPGARQAQDHRADRASMGPSTSVDGEVGGLVQGRTGSARLQWGRRQASTERDRLAPGLHRVRSASMGPSTSVDGEPRGPQARYQERRAASMGPSTSVDGESTAAVSHGCILSCFNGAVDKRRRRGRHACTT